MFPVALHTSYNSTLLEAIKTEACDYINLGDLPVRSSCRLGVLAGECADVAWIGR